MSSASPLPHLTGRFSPALLPQVIPPAIVAQVLAETGATSQRRRALPTDFFVYDIIALPFFMQASCCEVLRPAMAGKAAITLAHDPRVPRAASALRAGSGNASVSIKPGTPAPPANRGSTIRRVSQS